MLRAQKCMCGAKAVDSCRHELCWVRTAILTGLSEIPRLPLLSRVNGMQKGQDGSLALPMRHLGARRITAYVANTLNISQLLVVVVGNRNATRTDMPLK